MRGLIKTIITLSIIFSSVFILFHSLNIVDYSLIKSWLIKLQEQNLFIVALIIIILLTIDVIITIPTLALVTLSGYILGFQIGFLTSLTGLYSVGFTGYFLGQFLGKKFLNLIIKEKIERDEMFNLFNRHGVALIIFSRTIPMLPEITACLAGVSKLSLSKFFFYWSVATIPYASIATYAGSIGSFEAPQKTITILIVLISTLSCIGIFYRKFFLSK